MADAAEAPAVAIKVTAVEVELPDLETRIEWFEDWEESTREAQKQARRDRDYYDGIQWTREEIDILETRHQPVLTKNRIQRKINFILGEEIRKRVDPVARPRTPQHEDAARASTDALRFVEEEQEFDACRSAVAKNIAIEGVGGAIKELEDDGTGRPKHRLRHIHFDRLFWDPHSRDEDFGDAKYLGIVLWMDLDDAVLEFPDAAEALEEALTKDIGGVGNVTEDVPRRWIDRKRKRVKLCEMYFRIGDNWYRSVFTQGSDLESPSPTAYKDETGTKSVCPLRMSSCYVDQEGNRYGLVRPLISPQDEINKRASKQLHLLTMRQVVAVKDAVSDPQKFQTELAKPDGFAEYNQGFELGRDIQIAQTGDLAQGQFQLLQEAKQDIDAIGPSSATLPSLPESASGRAFIARQQAASQELGPFFDGLRRWTRKVFELDWLCIRQYWTEEVWLRVTDDQELNGYRFVALNHRMTRAQRLQDLLQKQPAPPLPKAVELAAGTFAPLVLQRAQSQAQQMAQMTAMGAQAMGAPPPPQQDPQGVLLGLILQDPLMQEPIVENQVEQMLVDIIIDEAPETAVLEQEEFDKFAELVPSLVQAGMDPKFAAKTVVRLSQFRDKRQVLAELEKGPDPKTVQKQQMAEQLQMAGAKAGVDLASSQAQLNAARAAAEQAKIQIAGAKLGIDRERIAQDGATIPSEIEKNQAAAMRDAASAGAKLAGPVGPPPFEGMSGP
jgi:hypothetical protein